MKRLWALPAVALLAVVETGCLVQVTKMKDPRPIFETARAEAERYAGRPGRPKELNILVWDPSDDELVRVSVPMWLVRKAERHADWDEVELGDDDVSNRVHRSLRGRLRLRDLEGAGLGTLVEVDEEDGEQVLVWLK